MPPPLVLLAFAFAVGIAAREALDLPLWTTGALLGFSSVALAVAWGRRRGIGVAALAQAVALGAMAAATAWPSAPVGLLDGAAWDVEARVVEAPERVDGRAHVLVALATVARGGEARAATGRVWLSLGGEPAETLLPGDRVRFHARLVAPRGFLELDAPDPRRRAAARGVIASAGVGDPAAVVRLDGDSGAGIERTIAGWRAWLVERVRARLEGDQRALVESLVLGERGDVPRSLDDAFRVAGVSHVLSVSGLHLAIAAALLFVGLGWLLGRIEPLARRVAVRRIAAVASLPATLLYTLLTGAAVATVRSCVVSWLWLGGVAVGRPATALTALSIAALAILGCSPLSLYDPSFQLSFAAALGGIALAPRWLAALEPRFPRQKWLRWLTRTVVALVVASTAATAATAPIAAWHFAQVAPVGPVSNVVVVPLAEMGVLPVGLAGCALAPIAWWLASPLLGLAGLGAGAMAHLVRWIATWAPAGTVPAPTLLEAALWYAALGALAFSGPRARRAALLFALAFLLVVAARAVTPRLHPALRVTFFDVGQGDSCLVELPDGKTLLVDGGGSWNPGFDPGEQLLVPWLLRHGTRRIEVVVLTHPHPDHANGLASIVARFPVGEVWTNGAPSELPGLKNLLEVAEKRGIPVLRPHRIETGGAVIEVLHPLIDGVVKVPPRYSENDGSIVLRIEWAHRALLLAGDVEARAEARLVSSGSVLAADVVKAPHHGSRTSSTAHFVAAVHPRVVVFSVGESNRWGFPAQEVDERWRAAGARTLRTDRDGAVRVTITANGSIAIERAQR